MASYQLIGPGALVTLDSGCTVTFEAIDPDTGAAVSGVAVSSATLYVTTDTPSLVAVEQPTLLAFEPLV